MRRDRRRIQCTIVQEKETVAKEERQIERYRARDISTGGERQEQRERVRTNSRETLIQKERDRSKGSFVRHSLSQSMIIYPI